VCQYVRRNKGRNTQEKDTDFIVYIRKTNSKAIQSRKLDAKSEIEIPKFGKFPIRCLDRYGGSREVREIGKEQADHVTGAFILP
jgi:hypothetical protein